MPENTPCDLDRINSGDFEIHNLDDEIRVDQLCGRMLLAIRDQLLARGYSPQDAGELCRGADYFLREFIIAECHDNLFRLPAERIRQFAGHWYIVRNLEPNTAELAALLAGIAACYRILAGHGLIETALAEAIETACADLPSYSQRIDDFWAITDNGYDCWRNGCPLPKPSS